MHELSIALVMAGTVVVVASSIGALVSSDRYHRLHFLSPITSLGGPLVAIGLCIPHGADLTTASILFPTGLLLFVGPAMTSAIARRSAQNEGRIDRESLG